MLSKNMYPVCARTFEQVCLSNSKVYNFYKKLGPLKLFDVTLRDGFQGLTKEQQLEFTFTEKKKLYNKILFTQNPQNIEVGSIVSSKVFPIFKDTMNFLDYTLEYKKNMNQVKYYENPESYILIPNLENLKKVISNTNINHFSFITSVSDKFQLKNTKMSLEDSDQDIYNMLYYFDESKYRSYKPNIKLYVSCINECPIQGKIDNDFIVNRLLNLSKMNVENICLSDTCGSLELDDFEYIIDSCLFFGLQAGRISLHLHVKPGRENTIEKIIHKALEYKIFQFDVSVLEYGGCSVTMKPDDLSPNLSYELYYKALYSYILKHI
jgi:isopropylmalate/homocitrate/citramalate synthase